MNVDCWSHISTFCDIRERGRLLVAHKYLKYNWSDLQWFYLRSKDVPLRQLVYRDWITMKNVASMSEQCLVLPNGQETSCWTPWCPAVFLSLRRRFVTLRFERTYNQEHAAFIKWIEGLAFGRTLTKRALTIYYKWYYQWQVPVGQNLEPIIFSDICEVRVRIRIVHLPYPIIERGRVVCDVQEFQFISNPKIKS